MSDGAQEPEYLSLLVSSHVVHSFSLTLISTVRLDTCFTAVGNTKQIGVSV